MSLELIRETIKINRIIGKESTQTIVENDIIVPDSKPDVARILLLDGDAFNGNAEVMQDRVQVNGVLNFKILYVSDEQNQNLKGINTSSNFSHTFEIPGAEHGMKCTVRYDVEHIEYNILNGRKINVKAIVRADVRVAEEVGQDIVSDLRGLDEIQILKENASIKSYIGFNEVSQTVREAMEVPAGKPTIRDILRSDVKISGKDYKITDNKIIAKGDLNISTLYIGDNEEQSIQFMEHEIPFTQFVDLHGISEESICDVDFRIASAQFDAGEDSDGELRVLNGEVVLDIYVEGFERKNIELIEDAFCPHARLEMEKEPLRLEELECENRSQVILKDTISVSEDKPEIAEVFNVLCKPSLSEYKVLDDKVIIEGAVNNSILYLSNNSEQPVFCHQQEIPFKQYIDLKGVKEEMSCDIVLDIEHCNYSMISSSEVEIRLVIGVSIKGIKQVVYPLIAKMGEHPIEDKKAASQPSITIYFAQPGDTLWKIAKRYYTTLEDIRKANNLGDRDLINTGHQILIPKRQ